MSIYYNDDRKVFHLQSEKSSYIIELIDGAIPAHVYWGPKLVGKELKSPLTLVERVSFSPNYVPGDRRISLDTIPNEFPAYGNGDFREPALEVHLVDGTTVTDFRYKGHTINKGKPALKGLPSTYVESEEEAETLEILLHDEKTGLIASLSYTVFNDLDVITRSVRIENLGKNNVVLNRVFSGSTVNAAPAVISRTLLSPCLQRMQQRITVKCMDSTLCIVEAFLPKQKWINME